MDKESKILFAMYVEKQLLKDHPHIHKKYFEDFREEMLENMSNEFERSIFND